MGKKILAIYYSQSGQLADIMDNFTEPLVRAGVEVEKVRIRLESEYPFPWRSQEFYAVMPDCVLGVSSRLASFSLRSSSYDLIILGYQAWFLSPSIPVNSLLHHPALLPVLKNTPVITITGARNMWVNAFSEVKKMLLQAGANLVGNIALVDRHPNHISYVTIFHWLLGGKKDRYLNFFPYPGVSAADIAGTRVFGEIVLRHLDTDFADLQDDLMRQKAVELKYSLLLLENKAVPTYFVWARFIAKRKKRNGWLAVFKYYLLFSLFVAAPVILILNSIFIRPFSKKRIKAQKQHYLALN
ncbi:MAG TPA: hypothetical protein VG605_12225 [Puia sp.]|nr:hypothetical protein [Puia sp.]